MADDEKIVEVIDRVTKSVVNVNTLKVFQDVFYRVVPVKGMGSGFIFDKRGYILTNCHVVENAERIVVTFSDSRVFEGKFVGACISSDVAVVKIDAENLEAAELGDSDKLRVGQRVFAIGNPFGLTGGPTVTSGVVSALNRTIHSDEGTFQGLVQTDAAINPGNSGGPLIDTEGKVIAINTAIIPFAQGIGFAVPINAAKSLANEIVLHGATTRPWLGITGINITPEAAEHYGLPVDRGVFVTDVEPDSPADRANIEKGDVISKFDDREVASVEELQDAMQQKSPGDRARLAIMRGTERKNVGVTLKRTP